MEQLKEIRRIDKAVELRVEEGKDTKIEGYATVFNQRTVIWGMFEEVIDRNAFTRALSEKQDTRALANHDSNLVLGRVSNGTLELRADETGLHDVITPNLNTSVGKDWLEFIKRGDVKGQSFQFTVRAQKWEFSEDPKVMDLRTILEIGDLLDVGPVTFPAYEGTSISARSNTGKMHSEMRGVFREMKEAFGVQCSELRCFDALPEMITGICDADRGRYHHKDAEGKSVLLLNLREYDALPLVRGLKRTPVSVLRQKLDLRNRE